jgi:ATP-dependent helicase/nuclease subunit A
VSKEQPVDHDARHRVRVELGTSFVLEAGAGTGKTTLLIERIVGLVRSGEARLDEIAAVTFTENAAATMKLRLREALERLRSEAGVEDAERERASAAFEVLERAQVSTIHALCAAMLKERPLECGVSPGFRVADDGETDVLFAEAWQEWLSERVLAGDGLLLEALDQDIPLEGLSSWGERTSLRGLARVLVEERDLTPLVAAEAATPLAWREELLEKAARVRTLIADVPQADVLRASLDALVGFAERSRALAGLELGAFLARLAPIRKNVGFRPHWRTPGAFDEAKAVVEWSHQAAQAWSASLGSSLHGRLVRGLLGVVAAYERKKAERGLLDFLDLLLKTRDALRDRESVRRYFRSRFRLLLIDEFQDTDPLQVEIARLMSGDQPGALLVVGDAKQSIYRFRRADVRLFQRASLEAARKPGHAVLQLTQNFRSRPSILRFVNRVFGEVIRESQDAEQPRYEPIAPPPGLEDAPSVIALRFDPGFEEDRILPEEARALTAWIARAAKGKLEVRDVLTGAPRPSRAGDVMVLVRRLTQLRDLEEELEKADLHYTVDGGKSFFGRPEVHEVLATLRAIDDPSDRVALVSALRSSLFGVSDRDIARYALDGGTLWLGTVDAGKPGAEALQPAFECLLALHRDRTRFSVPALIERLYDETRLLAALTGTRRGESQIANLEKVVALARRASDLQALTLRGFCTLLADRIENSREEPDLPVTRPDDPLTVRILSVHRAKGLEAPIVALHDTADNGWSGTDVIPLWDERRVAIGFRRGCQPPGWDALVRQEQARAAAESKRLLYVACTRARDWLVIPRPSASAAIGGFWRDVIDRLPQTSDADVKLVDFDTMEIPEGGKTRIDLRAIATAEGPDPTADRWNKDREALIARGATRPLRPLPAARAAQAEAPLSVAQPTARGRDFGSLVHYILELIPFDQPDGAAAMADALAPKFRLDQEAAPRAAQAVRGALALPVLERARRSPRVLREVRFWFPDEDTLIEGIVDLAFEEDGGLVVVDYKTDGVTAEQAIQQAAHHAPQLQLYGRGLTLGTGLPVKERLVLFTAIPQTVQV